MGAEHDLVYENEYEGVVSSVFSSRAVSQIVDFFLDHREFDYSPAEIAKKTGLSFRTIFRELPTLEKNQLVYVSRKIGKTSMYRLNGDFQAVNYLERFALEMSQVIQNSDMDTTVAAEASTDNANEKNVSVVREDRSN